MVKYCCSFVCILVLFYFVPLHTGNAFECGFGSIAVKGNFDVQAQKIVAYLPKRWTKNEKKPLLMVICVTFKKLKCKYQMLISDIRNCYQACSVTYFVSYISHCAVHFHIILHMVSINHIYIIDFCHRETMAAVNGVDL